MMKYNEDSIQIFGINYQVIFNPFPLFLLSESNSGIIFYRVILMLFSFIHCHAYDKVDDANSDTTPRTPHLYLIVVCQGYRYAAIQQNSTTDTDTNTLVCLCGNLFGQHGVSQNCTTPCPGAYSSDVCGGPGVNTILDTGISMQLYILEISLNHHFVLLNITQSEHNLNYVIVVCGIDLK